ncbi:MAG: hypothetical protein R8G66_24555 [Cytophagales bacterium]|nr:hypothetical protein [Cytophagales bacterium]
MFFVINGGSSNEADSLVNDLFKTKNYTEIIELYLRQDTLSNSSLDKVGKSYFFIESYDNGISILKKVMSNNINARKYRDAYANAYYIAQCFYGKYDLDSAGIYLEFGLQYATKSKDDNSIAGATNNLAVNYQQRNQYSAALTLYQKAIELNKSDTIFMMKMRCNMAPNYYRIGLVDSALQLSSEAFNFFQNSDIQYWKWLSTYRMAIIEKDIKNSLAKEYYEKAIESANSDQQVALALIGLADTYRLKKSDSVLSSINEVQVFLQDSKDVNLWRDLNIVKAKTFLEFNMSKDSLRKTINSLDSLQDLSFDHRLEALIRIIESKFHLGNENMDESLKSISVAVRSSENHNDKDRLSEALTQKFNVLNHFGRYKEALDVKEEEIKVQQELFNDRSEAVYQILRTQNEMDKQESTIANQQLEIDNNNLQITLMYISIALVVSALVFIFWQYRTRSKYAQKLETMFLDSRHRYMNNLLLLKNWFNEGKTENNDEIISFAQNRIDAISTVNRHLDRLSYNKDTIESQSFLEDISHNLLANREFTSEIENVPINMSVSGPLGMITNEIITNGLKYGEEPYAIRFHKNGQGYILEIEDHGPGIADPEKKGTGSKVLRLLSRQLKGELTYENKADHTPEGRGTLVSLTFKG